MAPLILSRQEKPSVTNGYTAGSLIAGAVVFVVLLCLLCVVRFQRSKGNQKRVAAPFLVRGVIRPMTTETNLSSTSTPPFSRSRITASIVMPEKTITRKPYPSNGFSDKTGVSSMFTPTPASSTLSVHTSLRNDSPTPSQPRALSILNPAHPRHHRTSSGFSGYTQYRFPRAWSSRLSFASFVSPSQAKPVHQPFEPTLTDELALRCGEHLTVLRSFDDGWCVVARDTSCTPGASLLAGTKNNGDNVDIGLVPAWVFSKPLEDVASKRPFRNTSLNALHFGQNPAYGRDWVTSWSNFS